MPGRSTGADDVVGGLLAAGSAFAYAVTVIVGRQLARDGLGSGESLGVRFAIAGTLLLGALAVTRRPLLPAPGERLFAFLLGVIGYSVQSTFFFLGLAEGTAAAVSLLFYAYPAIVTLGDALLTRTMPDRRALLAVAFSASGAATVAAAGGQIDITPLGIVFSLLAAVTFAAYVLAGQGLLRKTDSLTSGAWVATGAAIALLTRAATSGGVDLPQSTWPRMFLYGAATGVAFTCMFAALRRIGPARTAVIMTLEALFAVLLAAVLLGEGIQPLAALGGAGILAGAILSSIRRAGEAPEELPKD